MLIWKKEVPRSVSRLRWVVGVGLAAVAITIEVSVGFNPSKSFLGMLNAALAYFTAQALGAPKDGKSQSVLAPLTDGPAEPGRDGTCPLCGEELEISLNLVGQTAECPSCKGKLRFSEGAASLPEESRQNGSGERRG
jgi:hypothetical protein